MIHSLTDFNRSKKVNFKQIYADQLIGMKKYVDAYTSIYAGLDKHGYPVTGLTEDKLAPPVPGKPNQARKTIPGTRRFMEHELDLPEGTLKQSSDYWTTYCVKIGSDTIELDLENPHDLMKYVFLMAQSIVADGIKGIGDDSRIEYVIFSEEQEAETRVAGRKSLKRAYNVSEQLDEETKINILAVYGIMVDASSPSTIMDKLDEKIEENPAKFLSLVSDDYLVYKSLVTKLLDRGILIMKEGGIWHEEITVGYDKDSAAQAIAKDKTLEAVLKAKLSGNMELIQEALKAK